MPSGATKLILSEAASRMMMLTNDQRPEEACGGAGGPRAGLAPADMSIGRASSRGLSRQSNSVNWHSPQLDPCCLIHSARDSKRCLRPQPGGSWLPKVCATSASLNESLFHLRRANSATVPPRSATINTNYHSNESADHDSPEQAPECTQAVERHLSRCPAYSSDLR